MVGGELVGDGFAVEAAPAPVAALIASTPAPPDGVDQLKAEKRKKGAPSGYVGE
jgi:hypothetical protein